MTELHSRQVNSDALPSQSTQLATESPKSMACSSASVTGDFAIEWRESSIPPGYLIACGPPVIATTGNRWSRPIADR